MKSQNFETTAFGKENSPKAHSKNPIKSLFTERLDLVVSALIILTGICFITSVTILYYTGGETPYSATRVLKFLIAPLAFLAITVTVALIEGFSENKRDLSKSGKYDGVANDRLARISNKLLAKFDIENATEQSKSKLSSLKKRRALTLIIAIVTTVAAAVVSVLAVINIDRFTIENVNSDIARASIIIIAATVLTFAAWISHSFVCAASRKEESSLVKEEIRKNPALLLKGVKEKETGKFAAFIDSDKTKLAIRLILIIAAAFLIVLGILNGGMADVLKKAVKICTECIGLG